MCSNYSSRANMAQPGGTHDVPWPLLIAEAHMNYAVPTQLSILLFLKPKK